VPTPGLEPFVVRILDPKSVDTQEGETISFTCEAGNKHEVNNELYVLKLTCFDHEKCYY